MYSDSDTSKKQSLTFSDYMLRGAVSEDEYQQILPAINASNRQILIVMSIMAVVYLLFMFVMSFFGSDISSMRWLYFGFAVLAGALLAVVYYLGEKRPGLQNTIMYLFIIIVLGFGCVLGSFYSPDELSVTYIAFLLTVPMVFSDRPIRMVLLTIVAVFAFIICVLIVKTGHTRNIDIINACVFGTVSCFISAFMMIIKLERYVYAEKSAILSRIDLLTGLKNRNCFEQSLDDYSDKFHCSFACVYADANGLHTLNDTKGHDAGDVMLKTIGLHLQAAFGRENTYRIGGDEFLCFALDADEAQLIGKINQAQKAIEDDGYYISIGYALQDGPDIDIQSLIKVAEARMYVAKDAYYTRTGIARRVN